MSQQSTIPFIGGIKNGHRVTTDEYPQPWVRVIERPPIDLSVPPTAIDPSTPWPYKEHAYELKAIRHGAKFYIPIDSNPGDALAAALDNYPPPADPSKITVPAKLLYDALLQIGAPEPDLTPSKKLYSLVLEHYRNNPDTP